MTHWQTRLAGLILMTVLAGCVAPDPEADAADAAAVPIDDNY